MRIVADALSHIEIGSPVTSGNHTMVPLLNGKEDEPDYLTLDGALAQGIVTITQISESGSVPELRFVNKGDLSVLLMDGEELIGAKQNRILNLTNEFRFEIYDAREPEKVHKTVTFKSRLGKSALTFANTEK